MTLTMALAIVALLSVFAAAICDVRAFEIPDTLSIVLIVTAIGFGLLTPGFAWVSHLAAPLLMLSIGLLLFARGWMGGGDIKLLVGIAAWTGLGGLASQLVATAMAGGVVTLLLLGARKGVATAGLAPERTPKVFQGDAPIPYAVAIAIGTGLWAWRAWPNL